MERAKLENQVAAIGTRWSIWFMKYCNNCPTIINAFSCISFEKKSGQIFKVHLCFIIRFCLDLHKDS